MALFEFVRDEEDYTVTSRKRFGGHEEVTVKKKKEGPISFVAKDDEPLHEKLLRKAKNEGIVLKLRK
jgi:hypothetical protein